MDPGLCASCRHARLVTGANSRFWLCERSRDDARYPRYPRLPVVSCPGHEMSEPGEAPCDVTPRRTRPPGSTAT